MKKVTYPHLGNLSIALEALVQSMGLEPITPPPTSKKTIEIGTRYVAEEACFPLKITVGNILEGEECGADMAIMGGGIGPCRFGYYGEVQKDIAQAIESKLDFVIIEPKMKDILAKVKYLTGGYPFKRVLRGFQMALKKMDALDRFEKYLIKVRPFEKRKGAAGLIERKYLENIRQATSFTKIDKHYKEAKEKLTEAIETDKDSGVKIAIVGEFYMVIEKHANANIERIINSMGVSIFRNISLSNWITTNMLGLNKNKEVIKLAKPYVETFIGGHGRETVGETIRFNRLGLDGIIQLAPMTCMPEIIAESILMDLSEKYDIPILFIFLDEHSGEIGLKTRIEAFIDMLKFRKERKESFG